VAFLLPSPPKRPALIEDEVSALIADFQKDTDPVFPPLANCKDDVTEPFDRKLKTLRPLFSAFLSRNLSSVGDLAKMSVSDVKVLPVPDPLRTILRALLSYRSLISKSQPHPSVPPKHSLVHHSWMDALRDASMQLEKIHSISPNEALEASQLLTEMLCFFQSKMAQQVRQLSLSSSTAPTAPTPARPFDGQ
jgi:hypothetical protein